MKYKEKQGFPRLPKIIDLDDLHEKQEQLSKILQLLETHRFCDTATHLEAHLLRIALDKIVSDAREKAERDPAHWGSIIDGAHKLVSDSVERKLRELIQHELERNANGIRPLCEHIAETASDDWVISAAQKIPSALETALSKITRYYDTERIASTDITTRDLFKALKTTFMYKEWVEGLSWIVEYTADPNQPRFKANSRRLNLAGKVISAVAESRTSLKDTVEHLAAQLGIKEETIKELIRAISYAAYEGQPDEFASWSISRLSVEERQPDYRKTPSSLNDEIRRFYFIIYSADLKSEILTESRINPPLDPNKCREVAFKYLQFPEERDRQDMIDAYDPLPPEKVAPEVDRILSVMSKIVEIKARDMDAHPVRKVSWFKQRKGRITEWEREEIARAPPERLAELRRCQLEYNLLYEEAVLEFTLQVAELREFIRVYGSELNPEFKSIVAESLGFDPLTGEDIIPDEGMVDRYLSSLNKTLDRWNDLGKEFRKVPYSLERALKERYILDDGSHLSEAELEIIRRVCELKEGSKEEAEQLALLEIFQKVREDIEERLRSIAKHAQEGKRKYAQAMEIRDKYLGEFLPHK